MTTINCTSKESEILRTISLTILCLGVVSYLAASWCLMSIFNFSYFAFLLALPILLAALFFYGIGLCISSMTLNSEQESQYLHYKAKCENIHFEYFDN